MYAFRAQTYRIKLENTSSIRRMRLRPRGVLRMLPMDDFYHDRYRSRIFSRVGRNSVKMWAKHFAYHWYREILGAPTIYLGH